MNETSVPNNSASENAQSSGTASINQNFFEVSEQKGDALKGSNIITIGEIRDDALSSRYVPVSTLWTITPGNYPLSSEQIKSCTAIRFEGEMLLTQNYALGSIVVYQIAGEIGSHVIIVREDINGANDDRAIYCNSFNTTCYVLRQYDIPLAAIYRSKVLEPDQVLNTNLNKSLLQGAYVEADTKILDLNWHTEYYPTLYVHTSNFIPTEEHGYTKYDGRLINVGPFSTKVLLTDRNDDLLNPELEYLNNIIEISVDEIDAMEFLNCSITNNKYFRPLLDAMKNAGRKEYDFTTFNIDFFAVYVKLNLEEDLPVISRMVLAPDLPILENYLYQPYNPDYLGDRVDSII
ncbi:hypothetical protein [Acinetobacter gandensis]|uniref:hypothetical protein n=1 Tax=Acinetobacter gandensis TaxID=1443941 RepID=UPI00398985FF